jgi:manganese/zinc/iron transport system permease protein
MVARILCLFLLAPVAAGAQMQGSLALRPQLPGWDQVIRVLSLRDFNTRVVVLGTMLLGLAGGLIGTFLLLRRRALVADAVSHATLPGIGLAFLIMVAAGGTGKSLPGLLLGALVSGLLGMGLLLLLGRVSRLKEDTALGVVLSVFFGLGVAILGVIQKMSRGHAAGLESFIYGKTASMLASDATSMAVAAAVILVASVLLFKELSLLCFDPEFASTQGWPVGRLDALMMALVVAVTVIGLQSVGLILVVALLLIPAASARFWTDHLPAMTRISAGIGAVSGFAGAVLSALVPRLPAGAIIVVVASGAFVVSLVFGKARGMLGRVVSAVRFNDAVARQHLLRGLYELGAEPHTVDPDRRAGGVPRGQILESRSWSARNLEGLIRRAIRHGLVQITSRDELALTTAGRVQAQGVVRNHRLWEIYLLKYAATATGRVDYSADRVEHVLGPELVQELEDALEKELPGRSVPRSPHGVGPAVDGGRS